MPSASTRRLAGTQPRRLGSETRRLPPAVGGRLRLAVAYPNTYAVGMANLGFHALLQAVLQRGGVAVDRFFLPSEAELSQHRRTGTPLLGLESGRPLREFDVVLFSVAFEPDFVGVVTMLKLGGVEPLAARRGARDPLVVIGGLAAALNPEPVAPLCELVGVGEAEVLLPTLLDALLDGDDPTGDRLQLLGNQPGWYATLQGPHAVRRVAAEQLEPLLPVVISPEASFGRHVDVEISRGCRWRCRFCAAGHVVRPYRELSPDALEPALRWAVAQRGRVGLVGTDVSDHRHLEAIAQRVWQLGGEVALPSLRLEVVARRSGQAARLLQRQPPRTLTMALEAASPGLRCAVGKRLSDEKVLRAAERAAELKVERLKLYTLVGIPSETAEEVLALDAVVRQLLQVAGIRRIALSVNGLVPKPGTPLQWEPIPDRRYLRRCRQELRRALPLERVELSFESPDWTRWQALLSLGGRDLAPLILAAASQGWRRALARAEAEQPLLQGAGRSLEDALPWRHVDHGVARVRLWAERERCWARTYVPPQVI